ncbi:MAG: molybdopterin-binding protein [Megasphaera massiliensis]|uniref:MOSC domain-containing protein n=1 Tax=Megasphaera massiliensis TaxID=1232428 RepID=UPI00210C2E2B|nr:MOSC domain-containing protein [Megasphaera massiliensis]MCQ5210824.1 molybdopterin-binding protein [Megasphaera massiliensis]MEE0657616.1 molybdopterin-binding protein [Megasphaera massiliensis]
MGKIQAICSSDVRGIAKSVIPEGRFKVDWGLEGDAHAGHWHRQVSLLGLESIEDFRRRGGNVEFGAFGENLVVDGFIFSKLPVGTLLRCGDVLLEITQIGKACHSHCAVYEAVGDCIMPREGVFAKVLEGGVIHPGDEMVEVERGEKRPYQAAVITLSDKGSQGLRQDESGPVIVKRLEQEGYDVVETILLPDGRDELEQHLRQLADQRQVDLILTTGGTGFGQRDVTPEATIAVADRQVPGIAEAIRAASMKVTQRAMLSRAVSVIRKKTLIINLPGSPKACQECMDVFLETIPHGLDLLRGGVSDCARK